MATRLVTDVVTPGCEWVLNGEGVATEKFDGTCCLVRGGKLYRRYDAKQGKTPPADFEPAQDAPDQITGHWPGWIPVGDGPNDLHHREAWDYRINHQLPFYGGSQDLDWTFELIGPSVQGNPHGAQGHELIRHGVWGHFAVPRTYEGLREYLAECNAEGLVFWRDIEDLNCDKCKLKRKDFGLAWPLR